MPGQIDLPVSSRTVKKKKYFFTEQSRDFGKSGAASLLFRTCFRLVFIKIRNWEPRTNLILTSAPSESGVLRENKMSLPVSPTPLEASRALNFFNVLGKLKTLKRTGWIDHDVRLPESVADHMYRMSMLCFALTDKSLNRDRLIKVCLCHDLAEALVGDITPTEISGVSKEEKRRLEEDALNTIVTDLDNYLIGNEIRDLWNEYEERSTAEGIVAAELDKFEMIVQADEYEKQYASEGKRLDSFFDYTLGYFKHPEISAWDALLRENRNARWSSKTSGRAEREEAGGL